LGAEEDIKQLKKLMNVKNGIWRDELSAKPMDAYLVSLERRGNTWEITEFHAEEHSTSFLFLHYIVALLKSTASISYNNSKSSIIVHNIIFNNVLTGILFIYGNWPSWANQRLGSFATLVPASIARDLDFRIDG
jgi:hypothetical protein